MKRSKALLIASMAVLACLACRPGKSAKPLMGGDITAQTEEATAETADEPLSAEPQPTNVSEEPAAANAQPEKNNQQHTPDLCDVRIESYEALTPLRRYAYRVWYDEDMRIPVAVAWYLTGDHASGSFKRKGQSFHPDTDVKRSPVTTYDYVQSGYDRGHMCPSGDNKWSDKAQEQSFLMTNICPQNHNLNTNDWNDLEQLCRTWARRYERIYIVCGPLLRGQQHKTIGRQHRIVVPEAFYKVVLRLGEEPAAIGFVYDNKGQRQPMQQAIRSVDEIERLTGFDFFHQLDDDVEQQVEAQANLSDW